MNNGFKPKSVFTSIQVAQKIASKTKEYFVMVLKTEKRRKTKAHKIMDGSIFIIERKLCTEFGSSKNALKDMKEDYLLEWKYVPISHFDHRFNGGTKSNSTSLLVLIFIKTFLCGL